MAFIGDLHKTNGPVSHGNSGIVGKWWLYGKVHRYYGPAVSTLWDDFWYTHGKFTK